jgi:hypothetical protein
MINGMPEPSLLGFLPNNTPHVVNFSFFHLVDFDEDLAWLHTLDRDLVAVLKLWRFFLLRADGRGADVQHTCNIANTASIEGHLKNLLFDFRHATIVTVLEEKRLLWTAGILTAVPLCPLGGCPMLNDFCVLTRRTTNLDEGHGDLHDSVRTAFGQRIHQNLYPTRSVFVKHHRWNTTGSSPRR